MLMNGLQVVNANNDVVGEHLLVGGGLKRIEVCKLLTQNIIKTYMETLKV